jgi:hypothetical protein
MSHFVPGVRCGAYHAGLRPAERERVLGDWTGGRLPAVAATVAFGMGIDRGGVALVAHYNLLLPGGRHCKVGAAACCGAAAMLQTAGGVLPSI